VFTPSYTFPACFPIDIQGPLCLNLSCFGLRVGSWLTNQLLFPTFQLSSPIFFTPLCIRLGLPSSFNCRNFLMCVHTSHQPYGSTFYVVFMAMNALKPMMQFVTPLSPLCEMLASTWDENNYMCFLQPHSTPFIDKLTSCLPKMVFAL